MATKNVAAHNLLSADQMDRRMFCSMKSDFFSPFAHSSPRQQSVKSMAVYGQKWENEFSKRLFT
jgi:hypothetical protein